MQNKTIERLLKTAKPEFKTIGLGLVFLVLSSSSALAFPQAIRWLVDNVLQTKKIELLWSSVAILFFLFLLQGITSSLRYYFFSLSGERIVLRLRQNLFKNIMHQEVSFFDEHQTGELLSRLSSDCTTLQNTVSVNISMGLRNLGQVIGGLGFMFYTSWKLTIVMLVLIPPMALFAAIYGKKIKNHSKKLQESIAQSSIIAEETLSGVRTVKSFVKENFESQRYSLQLEEALSLVKSRIKAISLFILVAMVVGLSAVCIVLMYGGYQVVGGHLSIGDLTQFLLYLLFVAMGVGTLGNLWGDITSGIGASERIFELLEKKSLEINNDYIPENILGQIQFENVEFSYPSRPDLLVINNMSFSIEPGKKIAIVGSSGAGKSTIANLIPLFYPISKGQIKIEGKTFPN